MQIKNFGITGVGSDVQLGKAGPRVVANSASVELRTTNGTLTTLNISNGVQSSEAVTVAQLSALANTVSNISNTVSATDGFHLALGNVATDGDGSWSPGAVTLTDSTKISDAVDSLNEVLAKLVPSAPPAFPNGTAISVTSVGNTPLLAAGGVTDNSGTSSLTAGSSVIRITGTATSNTFSTMGPGDSGTLQLLLNGTVTNSRTFSDTSATGNGDNGTYGALVISGQGAYPSGTPGFWKSFNAQISGLTVPQGINKLKLNHTGASSTADFYLVKDNLTSAPTFSSGSVAQNVQGTLAYSSSIPHYGSGASLTIGMSITNLAGETYYGGSTPLTITGTNSIIGSQTYTYSTMGISTPITRQTLSATAITPVTVNLNGSNVFAQGNIQAQITNVVSTSSATNVAATNVLVMVGTQSSKVYELSVPVTGLGSSPNSNNAVRIGGFGNSDTPSGSLSAWTSSASLQTYDAVVVAGVLKWDNTNYSTGYLPVGPNLSGRSGSAPQYVTFAFQRTALSQFKINYSGKVSGCWVALPGVSDQSGISPNGATANGWWNMFFQYVGAGVPGQTGDTNAGCALGTAMGTGTVTSTAYTCTFGTQSSTNSTSNYIYVRFKLSSGDSITALSFTN